jgi:hypothetical protein
MILFPAHYDRRQKILFSEEKVFFSYNEILHCAVFSRHPKGVSIVTYSKWSRCSCSRLAITDVGGVILLPAS